ncbi:MAG: ubiquitin-like small modifier protein 1 [Methanobacterium sp.]|jgi:molybdopterin synthase sulfur carrier subunit
MVKIKFLARFKDITGEKEVIIDYNGEIANLIEILTEKYDKGFKDSLFNENGELREYMKILINGEDVRNINGLKTTVNEDDEIVIFQTIAGG